MVCHKCFTPIEASCLSGEDYEETFLISFALSVAGCGSNSLKEQSSEIAADPTQPCATRKDIYQGPNWIGCKYIGACKAVFGSGTIKYTPACSKNSPYYLFN